MYKIGSATSEIQTTVGTVSWDIVTCLESRSRELIKPFISGSPSQIVNMGCLTSTTSHIPKAPKATPEIMKKFGAFPAESESEAKPSISHPAPTTNTDFKIIFLPSTDPWEQRISFKLSARDDANSYLAFGDNRIRFGLRCARGIATQRNKR